MEIVKVSINDLKAYSNNVKEHPKEQIEQIKKSILEFGNNDPIAVDKDNVIIEGHGRYEALKQLGYKEVEVIKLEGLTEDQINAYRLVHNQLTMNTGFNLEMLQEELEKLSLNGITLEAFGFEDMQLEEDQAQEDDFNVEEALEEIEEPITQPGDVWQLGRHKLLCADSTKAESLEKLMQDKEADLLLTDPPYNVAVKNSQGMTIENDDMEDESFKKFLVDAFAAANTKLKKGGAFYIWHADSEGFNFRSACKETGWKIRQCLIWAKNSFNLGRQDYQWKHEPCLYGWKDGAAHYFINDRTQDTVIEDKIDVEKLDKAALKELLHEYMQREDRISTLIHEDKPLKNIDHPTMKPIKLMSRLITNSSKKEELVLDTFLGSGSTLIACEQLNRTCYGIELDPKYCDVIIKRWEQLTGEKAVRL